MAESLTASALTEEQWDNAYFLEYVRDNRFRRYMGTGSNNVIVMKDKGGPGDGLTVPLITRLTGTGVTGSGVLEGNEEQLGNYGHKVNVDWLRNGVTIVKSEQSKTGIAMREAAKEQLKLWSMEQLRDSIITALASIGPANTAYASAAEVADKDAWLAANSDRVLFGSAVGNNASNDHSAALTQIDSTNDKLTASVISLAKRIAKTADPHIRPIRTSEDEEWYVMFANSLSFRDLKTDSTMQQANREAWSRGRNNPLFRDGDLIYDGVIVREVPEIAVYPDVGDSATVDVGPNYLCGAQSLGIVWGQRPKSVMDMDRDYGFRPSVGIEEERGVEKLYFKDTKQHGVVTVYTSAQPDA